MDLWVTSIQAVNPKTGNIELWSGPNVPGLSFKDAEKYCDQNGMGYCKVLGRLVATIEDEKIIMNDLIKQN